MTARVESLPADAGPGLDPRLRAWLFGPAGTGARLVPWTALARGAEAAGATPKPLAEALAEAQSRYGSSPEAAANARALGDGALAVVAGQQPGLLGGTLLVAHKAAAAVTVAKALEARLSRRVVPVFWIASEDHDLDEVNRAFVLDAHGALGRLALDLRADGRSVRDVPLAPEAVETLGRALRALWPATPHAEEALALASPPPEPDLGSWFGAVLARVFGGDGLVLVEPHVVAPFAGDVFGRLVRGASAIDDAIRAAGESLREAGTPPPLEGSGGDPPLFLRERVGGPRRRPSAMPAPRSGESLARHVEAEPALASGDVVGRLAVQNALLPVVAMVAGPAELAYAGQAAEGLAAALGARFPAVAPRPSATWVEPRVEQALAAFRVPVADVVSGRTAAPPPPPVATEEADRASALAAEARALADADAASRAAGALRAAAKRLDEAAEARHAEAEERAGRGRARWERAMTQLRPRGLPQERVLATVALVARHGVDDLRAGLASLDPLAPGHQLVRVG